MEFEHTALPGVTLVRWRRHSDARGYFVELARDEAFSALPGGGHFVQCNFSHSLHHTLRGLHYQFHRPQAKLVTVIRGDVLDVVVDVRRGSPHFGRHLAVRLGDAAGASLFIPPGYAHGFLVLSETADCVYQCSQYYDPASERSLAWNDPEVAIDWPVAAPILSAKDAAAPRLAQVPAAELPRWGDGAGG